MTSKRFAGCAAFATAAFFVLATTLGHAQSATVPPPDETRLLAASCATCHGNKGDAYGVSKRLIGQKAPELYSKLIAYRDKTEPSTVMKEITLAYSPEVLRNLSEYFANQKAPLK